MTFIHYINNYGLNLFQEDF